MGSSEVSHAKRDHNPNPGEWIGAFSAALRDSNIEAALGLFDDSCFWRDFVAFTWNIKTVEGRGSIRAMLKKTLAQVAPAKWVIDGKAWESGDYVEAWFTFQTTAGEGRGHLRLIDGKCRTLLTTLESLSGHEEKSGHRRIAGTTHVVQKGRENWLEKRPVRKSTLEWMCNPGV